MLSTTLLARRLEAARGFNPLSLFASGELGAWFDASDTGTMWQDSAGSTPVTALEQPVGRWSTRASAVVATQASGAACPTLSARYNILLATATLATQSVTTLAAGYVLSFSGTGTVTLSGTATGAYSAGIHAVTCTAGALTLTVAGAVTLADLRLSVDAVPSIPAYQGVVTATNYDTIGFPRYLRFDGAQSLSTASVNFTGTDKITLWAGVTKLSDAAQRILLESSATAVSNAGAFNIQAPSGAAVADYRMDLNGSQLTAFRTTTFAAPVSNVVSVGLDIAGALRADEVFPRVNGVVPTLVVAGTANAGTGNFGNHALHIGRRNGSTLPFVGRLAQLGIRGAASTAAEIAGAERYVANKMGVLL